MKVKRRLRNSAAAVALLSICCGHRRDPLPQFPRVILWAWERPEDMRFVDPKAAGVAFLARTIGWRDGVTRRWPRMQPLRVRPGTQLMAVIRLEAHGTPPELGLVAEEIVHDATLPGVRAMQIDFDARVSERAWYASLLQRLRAALKPGMPLTITALSSWCESDAWIRALPIDDAVPMLFRMGAGESWDGREFRQEVCRSSVGVSTDEPRDLLPRGRRMFVFNPHSWTEREYLDTLALSRRWR
jgi:hypothetical protein